MPFLISVQGFCFAAGPVEKNLKIQTYMLVGLLMENIVPVARFLLFQDETSHTDMMFKKDFNKLT
jgi:hypothetical protein